MLSKKKEEVFEWGKWGKNLEGDVMRFTESSLRLVSGEWIRERWEEEQGADSEVQEEEDNGLDKSQNSGGTDNSVA